MIEVQLLIVADLDFLFGAGGNGKNPQFERFVVHLFQQARIAPGLLVAVINFPRAFLLEDLAHHFLSVDPHAEARDGRALGHRERVERFH